MKKEKRRYLNRIIYLVFLFLVICAGSICVDNEPVQAYYSSPKQVRKDIRKLNKKIKKLKVKSKKAYAKWRSIASGRSIGTADSTYMDRVSVKRGNPLVIQSGSTYYYLKGRKSNSSYFSGNIRTTGGYTKIDGMTCVNAQVVSGARSYTASNKASKKYKKYERQIENLKYDRSQLRKTLSFKVKKKNKTTYVGRKVKLKPSDTCGNTITWKSSNNKIATVTQNGVVTGKSPGKVVITAKTNLSRKKSKITVNVKKISTLELDSDLAEHPYLWLGETIQLGDNQEITSVHSSNERVVSRIEDGYFGEVCIQGMSVGEADVTIYGKKSQITLKIVVFDPHITFEKTEYNFDASALGTDVTIDFKSNIPLNYDTMNVYYNGSGSDDDIYHSIATDYEVIYNKKQGDGLDVQGKIKFHLHATGTESFYLEIRGRCGIAKSKTIKVSVTGTRLSHVTGSDDDAERVFLDDNDEIILDNSVNYYSEDVLTLHGATVHKAVSSDEDILVASAGSYTDKQKIYLSPRVEKYGTVTVTIYTEETGEKIELTVHVCRLNVTAEAENFEWRNVPILSYFDIEFLSGSLGINEVKGEVIKDKDEEANPEDYIEFGEYKDGKLYFTIKGMQHFWEDEYTVKISVNGFSQTRKIYVNRDEDWTL